MALIGTSALAEVITLKDGTSVEGTITKRSAAGVTVMTSSGVENVTRDKILDESLKALNYINKRGNYER